MFSRRMFSRFKSTMAFSHPPRHRQYHAPHLDFVPLLFAGVALLTASSFAVYALSTPEINYNRHFDTRPVQRLHSASQAKSVQAWTEEHYGDHQVATTRTSRKIPVELDLTLVF
jgi:hypothetical protein